MSDHIPLIVLFYRYKISELVLNYSFKKIIFSNTASLVGIAIVLNICCISLTREKR